MTSHEVPVTPAAPPERTIPRGFVLLTVLKWLTADGEITQDPTPTRFRSGLIRCYAWNPVKAVSLVEMSADMGQKDTSSMMVVQETAEAIDAQLREAMHWVS